MPPIHSLPIEVLLLVLENCDTKTRISAAQVCVRWRDAARTYHSLWNDIDLMLPDVPIRRIAPLLKRVVGYALPLPLSIFADGANMGPSRLSATYRAIVKLPLPVFKRIVSTERSVYLSDHFIGTNAAVALDPTSLPEIKEARLLSVVWIHHCDEGQQKDLVSLVEEDCLAELQPTLKRAGVVNRNEWLILHTRLNASTGRCRSIAIADWSSLTRLTLCLPGTYQYLPILTQTMHLKVLSLSFRSGCPPVQPGDDPLRTLNPFGHQPNRQIRLPYLQGLSLFFYGDSFHYPPSWNFLDSLGGCFTLTQFAFYSDHFTKYDSHMKINLLAIQLGISGSESVPQGASRRHAYYDPLYQFLRHAGQNLVCFHSVLGPGIDLHSLLESIGHERIICLALSSICWDPRQTTYDLQFTASQVLNAIAQQGFPNLRDLTFEYPISSIHDLNAIHRFLPSRSPVLKWFEFRAVNSDWRVIRGKGIFDGQRTRSDSPWLDIGDFVRLDEERPSLPVSFRGTVRRPTFNLKYNAPPEGFHGPFGFTDWSLERLIDHIVQID